eukprot:5740862-Heterocapsa_arctica.AAC.1
MPQAALPPLVAYGGAGARAASRDVGFSSGDSCRAGLRVEPLNVEPFLFEVAHASVALVFALKADAGVSFRVLG